ncbi:peptidase, partial [Nitrosopumilus sp. b1]
GYTAKVSWNAAHGSGAKIPFSFSFYDVAGNPVRDVLFAYSMIDDSGKEFWSNIGSSQSHLGILSSSGTSQESVLIPSNGNYQIKLILTGENAQNYESFYSAQSEFSVGSGSEQPVKKSAAVPGWVKNNAGWWADGTIADSEFLSAIKHLIKEEIIIVSQSQGSTTNSDEIPLWIKNNAGWWSQGQIDDESFLQGIQFMIKEGILRI